MRVFSHPRKAEGRRLKKKKRDMIKFYQLCKISQEKDKSFSQSPKAPKIPPREKIAKGNEYIRKICSGRGLYITWGVPQPSEAFQERKKTLPESHLPTTGPPFVDQTKTPRLKTSSVNPLPLLRLYLSPSQSAPSFIIQILLYVPRPRLILLLAIARSSI